jgi:hypothetical protein
MADIEFGIDDIPAEYNFLINETTITALKEIDVFGYVVDEINLSTGEVHFINYATGKGFSAKWGDLRYKDTQSPLIITDLKRFNMHKVGELELKLPFVMTRNSNLNPVVTLGANGVLIPNGAVKSNSKKNAVKMNASEMNASKMNASKMNASKMNASEMNASEKELIWNRLIPRITKIGEEGEEALSKDDKQKLQTKFDTVYQNGMVFDNNALLDLLVDDTVYVFTGGKSKKKNSKLKVGPSGKSKKKNSKLKVGPRGGKYYMKGGNKIYV